MEVKKITKCTKIMNKFFVKLEICALADKESKILKQTRMYLKKKESKSSVRNIRTILLFAGVLHHQ